VTWATYLDHAITASSNERLQLPCGRRRVVSGFAASSSATGFRWCACVTNRWRDASAWRRLSGPTPSAPTSDATPMPVRPRVRPSWSGPCSSCDRGPNPTSCHRHWSRSRSPRRGAPPLSETRPGLRIPLRCVEPDAAASRC